MLTYLVFFLILFWLLGIVKFPVLSVVNSPIIYLGYKAIGVYDILVFILIVWLIRVLPSPLREIVSLFLVIWVLSFFGLFFFGGLANLLILLLIIGLILHIFGGFF